MGEDEQGAGPSQKQCGGICAWGSPSLLRQVPRSRPRPQWAHLQSGGRTILPGALARELRALGTWTSPAPC